MHSLPARKRIRLAPSAYRQGDVFSVTISTFERYPWFGGHPELAGKAVMLLTDLVEDRGTELYAWCIMPDHVHLLVCDIDLVQLVRLFKGRLTPSAHALNPDRPLWQRSFYDHGLRREESLVCVAEYIWENPVRAKIVDDAADYPWSGSTVWKDWKGILSQERVGASFMPARAGMNPQSVGRG